MGSGRSRESGVVQHKLMTTATGENVWQKCQGERERAGEMRKSKWGALTSPSLMTVGGESIVLKESIVLETLAIVPREVGGGGSADMRWCVIRPRGAVPIVERAIVFGMECSPCWII